MSVVPKLSRVHTSTANTALGEYIPTNMQKNLISPKHTLNTFHTLIKFWSISFNFYTLDFTLDSPSLLKDLLYPTMLLPHYPQCTTLNINIRSQRNVTKTLNFSQHPIHSNMKQTHAHTSTDSEEAKDVKHRKYCNALNI